jgi:hypothetical protein
LIALTYAGHRFKHRPALNLPLLGQPFWQGFEYTINQQKKVIEFVRR